MSAANKCPVCASDQLSPETEYASFDNHARFRGMGGTGFLGQDKDLTMGAGKARVCLDCGYLLLFVSDKDLRELKDSLG